MTQSQQVTPLTIADVDFTVARQIEQCPKTMMLREIIMNAVEAAAKAPEGSRNVEIKSKEISEFPNTKKLAVWNAGPGMSSAQLDHICDLASSLGKDMALDGNFGMGAKVASLPSNTVGMRYRSCHNGVVSQVILGKRDGVYGKIHVFVEGKFEDVVDVTDIVKSENEYSLSSDWTEVVLFGNEKGQDTVVDPYNNDPKVDRQWIPSNLYHRFYYLPEGVQIYLHPGTHTRDGRRLFKTIPSRRDVFERVETVDAGNGIKIHYYYDAPYKEHSHNKSVSGSLSSAPSACAIIYRGEMYDLHVGRKWTLDAPAFGIPFGAKHISIHLELPNDYPVRPEPYRRFIQLAAGDQRQLTTEEFSELIIRHRPQWLIDIISSLAPKPSASTDDLRRELQDLLNELRIRSNSPRIMDNGEQSVDDGDGRGAEQRGERGGVVTSKKPPTNSPSDLVFSVSGAKRANISKNLEQAPEIIPLRTEEEVSEREISGKAARYYRETNQLFVNLLYPAVASAKEDLAKRYAAYEDPELMRRLVIEAAESIAMARVGHAVVFAQAKQLVKEWTNEDVKKALEPESLSLAADGWRDSISGAYQKISKRLGMSAAKLKGLPSENVENLANFH